MERSRAPITTAAVASVAVMATVTLINRDRGMMPLADGFVTQPTRPSREAHPSRGSPSFFQEADWPCVALSPSLSKIYSTPPRVLWKQRNERRGCLKCPGRACVGRRALPREDGLVVNTPPTGTPVFLDGAECTDRLISAEEEEELGREKGKIVDHPKIDTTKAAAATKNATALTGKRDCKKSKPSWRSFFRFGHDMKVTDSGYHSGDHIGLSGRERGKIGVKCVDHSNNATATTETTMELGKSTSATIKKGSMESMPPWPSFLKFGWRQHTDVSECYGHKEGNETDVDEEGFLRMKMKPSKDKESSKAFAKESQDRNISLKFSGDGERLGSEQTATGNSSFIEPKNSTEEKVATNAVGTLQSGAFSGGEDFDDVTVAKSTPTRARETAKDEGARAKLKSKPVKGASSKVGLDDEGVSLDGINPTAPLTLSDLDTILRSRGYVHRSEIAAPDGRKPVPKSLSVINDNDDNNFDGPTSSVSAKIAGRTERGGVAFPQPSILSYHDVSQGTIVASIVLGMVLGSSVNPNLWLVGCVLGVMYGQSLGKTDPNDDRGAVGNAVTNAGRKIAKTYLNLRDMIQTVWFMYRTGQLSYEYYRRYEAMDERFHIQDKMDAWNARFVEGKNKFDEWEKENEVGRRVLAGVRTMVLVNEKSYKKQMKKKPKSKYRIIQIILDAIDWLKRFARASWRAVMGGDGGTDMRELLEGIRIQVSGDTDLAGISRRAGSAVAALVAVNAIGAVFAISPTLLGALAVTVGILWPDWVGEVARRVGDNLDETRARGRGEKLMRKEAQTTSGKKQQQGSEAGVVMFNYFLRQDGSKRWYRTGQPVFPWMKVEEEESRGLFDLFRFPDKRPKQKAEEQRWWTKFSSLK